MTDREMLELAAKAAGRRVRWHDSKMHHISGSGDWAGVVWDPLTNDGDALRLAVDCRMMDGISKPLDTLLFNLFGTSDAEDKHAAVRRAIVRAAGEIGRTK